MDPAICVLLTYLTGLVITVGIRSLQRSKSYTCGCSVVGRYYDGNPRRACQFDSGPMCEATKDYLVTVFWPVLLPTSLVKSVFGRFAAKREEKFKRIAKVRSELGID